MQWMRRAARPALLMLALLPGAWAQADSAQHPVRPAPTAHAASYSAQEQAWIAAHPVIRITVDPHLRPLEYIQDGKYKGLTADYMAAIGKASGLRFEVVPVAPNEMAEALRTGKIDLFPAVSPSFTDIEIRKQLIISEPYFVGGTIIVTRGFDEIIFDPRKLDGKTVALKGGGMYEQILRKNFPDIHMHLVATPEEALAEVAAETADAAIGIDSVLLPILYGQYHNELHVSGTIAEVPAVMSIGVRNDFPELAAIMEKSLAAMTAKETDDIVERWMARENYGPPTWAQILRYRTFESILVVGVLILLLLSAQHARRARRTAEKSEQDKARFLAVMSHEIRTPMNAILSSVELLGRSKLTQQQRQLSDLATTASEALLDLLDDVLDLSKLEARRLTLAKQPTDMQQLVRGVVEISELPARKKNLDIALQFDLPAATDLLLDPARIRQILINLTSNAVKFTERGLVQVMIALEREEASPLSTPATPSSQATLLLIVSDTGVGVPADRQKDLFRPYHQAHQTSTRRFGGTGLGLTICRELCELMGGSILFSSAPDVGTSVTCRIPVELVPAQAEPSADAEPPAAMTATTATAQDNANTSRRIDADTDIDNRVPDEYDAAAAATGDAPHILVVEDHPGNRMVLQQQLTQLGYRFTIVNDGRSALEQTARQAFSLMLLDCYLPDIDGYAVASEQRAREAGMSHLPIIAISAAVDQEHLDACMGSGMDGTLRKPLRLAALEKLLGAWCGPGRTTPAQAAGLPDMKQAGKASTSVAGNADLATVFMQTAREDLAGLEAALTRQDHDEAARIAHRMHGAALVCKWPHIAALAVTIEQALKESAHPNKVAETMVRLRLALAS